MQAMRLGACFMVYMSDIKASSLNRECTPCSMRTYTQQEKDTVFVYGDVSR